jgi:AcrR family transcriptional regulator
MPKVVHHLFKPDEKHLEQIEESLLLGASDLIKNTRVENIKIDDLVNKAEVSRSTFYKVFHSVDDLFKKLGKKITNEIMEYTLSNSPQIPDAAARVAIKTKRALLLVTKAPLLASLRHYRYPLHHPQIRVLQHLAVQNVRAYKIFKTHPECN